MQGWTAAQLRSLVRPELDFLVTHTMLVRSILAQPVQDEISSIVSAKLESVGDGNTVFLRHVLSFPPSLRHLQAEATS